MDIKCKVGKQIVIIHYTSKALTRIVELGMTTEAIYGGIKESLDTMAEMPAGKNFVLIDKVAMCTSVCAVADCDDIKQVSIITVVSLADTLVKDNQEVIAVQ